MEETRVKTIEQLLRRFWAQYFIFKIMMNVPMTLLLFLAMLLIHNLAVNSLHGNQPFIKITYPTCSNEDEDNEDGGEDGE